jgi:hypothetical protein
MKLFLLSLLFLVGCTENRTYPVSVGPEIYLRGPAGDMDNQLNALLLPSGGIASFSGNGNAKRAVAPTLLTSASLTGNVVVGYGNNILYWLNHVEILSDGRTLGFFHSEQDIDYSNNFQTHKSMNVAFSPDYGITWSSPEFVITSPEGPIVGQPTGEGDCTMVDGQDEFFYAYCLRVRDYVTIVARAAKRNPEVWYKYFKGQFSEPGLGGNSDSLGYVGTNVSYRDGAFYMVQTDGHNIVLFSSSDKIHFGAVQLLSHSDSIVGSPSLIDANSGSNIILGNSAILVYTLCMVNGSCTLMYRALTFGVSQ